MRKSRFSFVPQDSGPTGLSASAPIVKKSSEFSSPVAKPVLLARPLIPASSPAGVAKDVKKPEVADHDSPSQALLKLSQAPSEAAAIHHEGGASVSLRETSYAGVPKLQHHRNDSYQANDYRQQHRKLDTFTGLLGMTPIETENHHHPRVFENHGSKPIASTNTTTSSGAPHLSTLCQNASALYQNDRSSTCVDTAQLPSGNFKQHRVGFHETLPSSSSNGTNAPSLQNHVMDYAAGLALRNGILIPLSENLDEPNKADLVSDLGSYFRGQRALSVNNQQQQEDQQQKGGGSIVMAKVTNIRSRDAATVRSWYTNSIYQGGGDRFLSYSNEAWNREWVDRCRENDSGFEMIKLVSSVLDSQHYPQEVLLAVALVECNAVTATTEALLSSKDKAAIAAAMENNSNTSSNNLLPRSTIIHGVRIAPFCNPDVSSRASFCFHEIDTQMTASVDENMSNLPSFPYRSSDLLAYLLQDILNRSLLYGTSSVVVHCPKQTSFERFYRSVLGNPVIQDENGRYVFHLKSKDRMDAIRHGFNTFRSLKQNNSKMLGLAGFSGFLPYLNAAAAANTKSNTIVSAASNTTNNNSAPPAAAAYENNCSSNSNAADYHVGNPPPNKIARSLPPLHVNPALMLSRIVSEGNNNSNRQQHWDEAAASGIDEGKINLESTEDEGLSTNVAQV